MGDGESLGDLGQLADHAAQNDAPKTAIPRGIERGLDEVAHLHETSFRPLGILPHGAFFGATAGGEHHGWLPLRGSDLHRLHHAGPERRRRIGMNDAADAQNGNAAENTQPGIEGLASHVLAAGHRNRHFEAGVVEQIAGGGAHVVGDVPVRYRVDGRTAHLQPESFLRHRTDTRTSLEN